MIPKLCKRLARLDFWIAVVSKHSVREKFIRCNTTRQLREVIKDPARLQWGEVRRMHHCTFPVNSLVGT